MKNLLPSAALLLFSALAVSFMRATPPARVAQANAQGLEGRVSALESELAAERQRHDETRALLDQALTYLEKQSKGAQTLLGALDESEQQGFATGENWRSRQTLLAGLRAYWGNAEAGLPKVPAKAPPVKPAPPSRSARKE